MLDEWDIVQLVHGKQFIMIEEHSTAISGQLLIHRAYFVSLTFFIKRDTKNPM